MSTSFNNSTSAFNSFPLNREITTEEFYAHYVLAVAAPLKLYCPCMVLLLGSVTGLLTPVGVFVNICVIVLFTKASKKHIQSRVTYLLRSLALSDGVMAALGGTMFSVNCFYHKWVFSRTGCLAHGIIMLWCGTTSIAHLCTISLERWYTMTHIQWSVANKKKVTVHVYIAQVVCWVYGFIWAILPQVGFQSYTVVGKVSCSIDWFSRSAAHKIYNITIFVTVFIIPGIIITATNTVIFKTVSRAVVKGKDKQYVKREIELARKMVYSKVFYLLAWTPYGIISVWATINPQSLPPVLLSSAAFFAKLSFTLNPLLYVGMNAQYRKEMCTMLFPHCNSFTKRSNNANQVSRNAALSNNCENSPTDDEQTGSESDSLE